MYAKYYFDLRALADAHNLSFPLEPLSKERAQKLEVIFVQGWIIVWCVTQFLRTKINVSA